VLDSNGYRFNVGIILSNVRGQVFWARRTGMNAWQFPQGGIKDDEEPAQAMFRELWEEVGLTPEQVEIVGCTRDWLHYRLPRRYVRPGKKPVCIGQKQLWFVLRMLADDHDVRLDRARKPEFDGWRWVHYWYPVRRVVFFKRDVYRRALTELAPLLFTDLDAEPAGVDAPRGSTGALAQQAGTEPSLSGPCSLS
jgi:putative (di)nucleoside polyphosphate hydrolase